MRLPILLLGLVLISCVPESYLKSIPPVQPQDHSCRTDYDCNMVHQHCGFRRPDTFAVCIEGSADYIYPENW